MGAQTHDGTPSFARSDLTCDGVLASASEVDLGFGTRVLIGKPAVPLLDGSGQIRDERDGRPTQAWRRRSPWRSPGSRRARPAWPNASVNLQENIRSQSFFLRHSYPAKCSPLAGGGCTAPETTCSQIGADQGRFRQTAAELRRCQ